MARTMAVELYTSSKSTTPWLWTSTFLQLKKMTLLEVYLTARTTHLLLEATPWEMLMEHLLSFLTLPYTVDEVDGFNAHCFLLLVRR